MPWRLTEPAARDLLSIAEYTAHQWGDGQAWKYKATLIKQFDRIAEDPFLLGSRAQDEYSPGSRSILVERHVVVYRLREGVTEVLRILHQRMDLSLHYLR